MSGNPVVIKRGKHGIGIDVGWRVTCTDGFVDVMWGNTKNERSLALLLQDVERQYGKKDIIDERAAPVDPAPAGERAEPGAAERGDRGEQSEMELR